MNTNTIQQQLPVNAILHGDCIDVMRNLPANSVDFILTDPPYLVNYRDRDGTIENDVKSGWLKPAMAEAYRARPFQNSLGGVQVLHIRTVAGCSTDSDDELCPQFMRLSCPSLHGKN